MTPSQTTYDAVAKTLHWLIALAIFGALAAGWVMTSDLLPNGPAKFSLFQLHKSVGIAILALSLFRLAWRLMHPPPPLPASMKKQEVWAAKLMHWGLYALMIGIPLVGWMLVSTSAFKTQLFGILPLPNLPVLPDLADKKLIGEELEDLHGSLAVVIAVLVALHVGAALKHHFVNRDDVLRRMLPRCCGMKNGER